MNKRCLDIKTWVVALLLIVLSCVTTVGQDNEGTNLKNSGLTDKRSVQSYAIGMNVARQVQNHGIDVDIDLVMQGLKDTLSGSPTLLTTQQAQSTLNELQRDFKTRSAAMRQRQAETNAQAGQKFLSEHKQQQGVVTLENGLQYKVLKAGDGKKPAIGDTVVCHYRGTLVDGKEFDSSYSRGQPATFSLRRVIRGWREGLVMMPSGSKWELVIPPTLAYGSRGHGKVGPNATLIFEVELLSVSNPAGPATVAETIQQAESTPAATDAQTGKLSPEQIKLSAVAGPLTDLRISFMLDSRLSGPTYGGERWSATLPFNSLPQGGSQATVFAKVDGIGKNGIQVPTIADWISSDKQMVTISAGARNQVTITVHRPGESKLTVASSGVSKELLIKATQEGNATRVVVSQ